MKVLASATHASRRAWIALAVVCLGQFMVVLDQTIVNVALDEIQRDLHFSQAALTWVVNAYLVTFGSFMLVAGRVGDLVGRRRVFLFGVALFTLASIACGFADSQGLLIAARFVQGIGGAVAFSVTIALIVSEFPDAADRAKAMSVYMFVAVGGGSVGLLLGGLIAQSVDWHWIFFINVPIGAATLLLGRACIDERETIGLDGGVDWLGAGLVTVALMLAVYAIVGTEQHGWGSPQTLGWGGAALALLVGFFALEARIAQPILPLQLFRVRGLAVAAAVRAFVFTGMFAVFFFGALYMEQIRGLSPLGTGVAFLPMTLTVAALSLGPVARLIQRFGPRPVLIVGVCTLIAGLVLFATASADVPYAPLLLVAFVVMGLGGGSSFVPLLTIAMADVPPRDAGIASGIMNVAMQLGAALGLALLGALAAHRTTARLADGASHVAAQLSGYHLAFALGAGATVVGLLLSLFVLRSPRPQAAPVEAEVEAELQLA
ncbi:MAG: MFS transporter [Actinobacteria bacterium]|nr:MFS transporter [Actinomycetota bacterium]